HDLYSFLFQIMDFPGSIFNPGFSRIVLAEYSSSGRVRRDPSVIIGTGVCKDHQNPVCSRRRFHKMSRSPESQSVPVPAGGTVAEDFFIPAVVLIAQKAAHNGKAFQSEKRIDLERNSAFLK